MRASPLPFSLSAVLLIGLVGSSPTIRLVDGGVDQSLDRPVWMKLLSASASFSAVESNSSASLTVIHGPRTAAPSTQAEDEQLDSDLPTTRISSAHLDAATTGWTLHPGKLTRKETLYPFTRQRRAPVSQSLIEPPEMTSRSQLAHVWTHTGQRTIN